MTATARTGTTLTAARMAEARKVPGWVPEPRLPRSPRVRDRWARMRPPIPLTRRWPSALWDWDVEPDAPRRWIDACRQQYGAGETRVWRDYGTDTVVAEFRPTRTSRRA